MRADFLAGHFSGDNSAEILISVDRIRELMSPKAYRPHSRGFSEDVASNREFFLARDSS